MGFATSPLFLVYLITFGLVVHAAVTDYRTMKILNTTNLCILLAAVAKYALRPDLFTWDGLGMAIGIFVVGVVIFHMIMKFGAGDIKFLGVFALFLGEDKMVEFLIWSGVIGGVLSLFHLFVLVPAMKYDPTGLVERAVPYLKIGRGKTIPYGLALAPAAVYALFLQAQMYKVI